MNGNVRVLTGVCATLPAATMAAAHWFPWRRLFRRDLHKLEAYTIGTTAIVGTAAIAISASGDGSGHVHSRMLLWAAGGAGITTLVAYAVDEFIRLRGEIAALKAEHNVLSNDSF